jgi:hypothetical protein
MLSQSEIEDPQDRDKVPTSRDIAQAIADATLISDCCYASQFLIRNTDVERGDLEQRFFAIALASQRILERLDSTTTVYAQ